MSHHWAIYIQGSGVPVSCCGTWCGSVHRMHISLLCKMAFQLSSKVIALHLDNNAAKAYLCNQGGTASAFLCRLACSILNMADKHSLTLILAYIPTHLIVEAISLGVSWFPGGTLFLTQLRLHVIFWVNWRCICWHPQVVVNVSAIKPWKISCFWDFWG